MDSDDESSHPPTPSISEAELEAAFLRSVIDARPIGRHRHFLMIKLQEALHKRTGVWVSCPDLWDRLGEVYDLEALESMSSSSSSLPASPRELSPLPRKRSKGKSRPRTGSPSLSPLSDQPAPLHSRSAEVIDSSHFSRNFALPYFLSRVTDNSDMQDEPRGGRSKSVTTDTAGARARSLSRDGQEDEWGGDEVDLSGGEEQAWHGLIYSRAAAISGGGSRGVDEVGWEKGWDRQVQNNRKAAGLGSQSPVKGTAGRQKGRLSDGSKRSRRESSELSTPEDEPEEEEEEKEEEEEEVRPPRKQVNGKAKTAKGRGSTGANVGSKRKRDSQGSSSRIEESEPDEEEEEEEEDEHPVKSRRRKR